MITVQIILSWDCPVTDCTLWFLNIFFKQIAANPDLNELILKEKVMGMLHLSSFCLINKAVSSHGHLVLKALCGLRQGFNSLYNN